jgi:protein-disulfide isomerase
MLPLRAMGIAALLAALAAGSDNIQGNAFGSPAAPIQMEIFSDFQCPGCKRLHDEELPSILRDYVTPGKVYLIYRYFPLPGHAYGRQSADLACAAAQLGKFQAVADILFARQAVWSADGKVEDAVDSVLTTAEQKKVRTLIKYPAVQSQVNQDVDAGNLVPIRSTPTLLVTYRMKRYPLSGEGVLNYGLLKSFLDGLLVK